MINDTSPPKATGAPFAVTEETVLSALQNQFGITGKLTSLPSYSDVNFLVTQASGKRQKVSFANPSVPFETLDFQNQALQALGRGDLGHLFPKPIPNRVGNSVVPFTLKDGRLVHLRLFTYLEGTPLGEYPSAADSVYREIGALLARADQTLANFEHPGMRRTLEWDLAHLGSLKNAVAYVHDAETRARIEKVMIRHDEVVLPRLASAPKGVIHNDANDYNILVTGNPLAELEIAALIDPGDMVYSHRVFEVAVAAMYAAIRTPNPLDGVKWVLQGYNELLPLEPAELECLYDLVLARICQSILISSRTQVQESRHDDYLTISQRPALIAFKKLWTAGRDWSTCVFKDACGIDPVPAESALRTYLERLGPSALTVLPTSFRQASIVLEDHSVASASGLGRGLSGTSEPGVVGIGRYGEPRLAYASHDGFSGRINAPGSERTIHMGVDVFVAAGTPILAPLGGRVHSIANNDRPGDYGPTVILEHSDGGHRFYTLYGHLGIATLDRLQPGDEVATGDAIGTVGSDSENGGWRPHLHFQLILHMLGNEGDYPGVASPDEWSLRRRLSPSPARLLGLPEGTDYSGTSSSEIIEARKQRLGSNLSLSYSEPLQIVRGKGQYLFDERGRRFLDCVNNVCHVGHANPAVVRAAAEQMILLNTNTRYLHKRRQEYLEALVAEFPDPLTVCFLVNSGSEANDLAIRLAQAHTGRTSHVVLGAAYHGHLSSIIPLSPYKFDGAGGAGKPASTIVLDRPDSFRGKIRGILSETGPGYVQLVRDQINELAKRGELPAAFFAESILSCGGQIVLPDGYLRDVYDIIRAVGGICVADEVQVGFGRVGSHMWGFETQGVVPDIVTLGKPIGNGHPMAAVVTTRAIADSFANGMEYFNTFGGNPVSCAIGLEVLREVKRQKLMPRARLVGDQLLSGFKSIMKDSPIVGDVRGMGLFLGVEFCSREHPMTPAPREASYVVSRMLEMGILLSTDGPDHNVIKMKPPMTFSEEDGGRVLGAMSQVVKELR